MFVFPAVNPQISAPLTFRCATNDKYFVIRRTNPLTQRQILDLGLKTKTPELFLQQWKVSDVAVDVFNPNSPSDKTRGDAGDGLLQGGGRAAAHLFISHKPLKQLNLHPQEVPRLCFYLLS